MRTLYILLIILLNVSCNSKKVSNTSVKLSTNTHDSQSNFIATLEGKKYTLQVNCLNIDKDYFQFKSDKLDNADTNGDGLVVSGFYDGENFVFTIIDYDKIYNIPELGIWSKYKKSVMGSGKLYLEGTTKTFEVEFELNCN